MYLSRVMGCFCAFSVLALGVDESAHAAAAAVQESGSTVSYNSAFFTEYNPVTLNDMIQYVPGGIALLNELRRQQRQGGARGFGSTGAQILIDGKRLSGKANNIIEKLSLIQASQIERIDLIRGTAEGLDIRNEGVLINVILRADARNMSTNFIEVTGLYNKIQGVVPELVLSHNGSRGSLDYGINYTLDRFRRTTNWVEDRLTPDGTLEEVRIFDKEQSNRKHRFTGEIKYQFDNGDTFRLNGLYEDEYYTDGGLEDQFDPTGDVLLAQENLIFSSPETKWEIGGDYEGSMGVLGSLKALFVFNHEDDVVRINQDEIVDGVVEDLFDQDGEYESDEKIFRASFTKTLFGNHTFEYGAEGAFNKYLADQTFDFGELESSEVSEDRYEVFVTHSVKLNEKLTLSSAMTREFSSIDQDSVGVQSERSFQYWKPRIEARYDIDNSNQIRFLVERSVSQLDLDEFVASRNVEDDTIDLGNPNLEPEKTYKFSVKGEHRFPNNNGTISAELFYDKISDHIDKIAITNDSAATGNVGDADRIGFDLEANSKLGFIGLDNASLTVTYQYRDSDVTDPFLLTERRIKEEPKHTIFVDYRHDLTDLGLIYGFSMHRRASSSRTDISLFEFRQNRAHFTSIYAEYLLTKSVKLRADMRQLFQDKKRFTRTIYDGNIADDVVDRIEFRRHDVYPTFVLKLQATF